MKKWTMKEKYIEVMCYGILGIAASFLFVFGAMYPDCIYLPGSYIYEGTEISEPVYEMDKNSVRVSSKVYESLKAIIKSLENEETGETENDKRCIIEYKWDAASGRRKSEDGNDYDWELL